MLGKRGSIAWFLLALVSIVLIGIALFVMIGFSNRNYTNSGSFSSLAREAAYPSYYAHSMVPFVVQRTLREVAPESNFRSDFESRFVELMGSYDPGDGRFGTLFGVVRNRHYLLTEETGTYTLVIPNVEQSYTDGTNRITRTFNVTVQFTRDGLL